LHFITFFKRNQGRRKHGKTGGGGTFGSNYKSFLSRPCMKEIVIYARARFINLSAFRDGETVINTSNGGFRSMCALDKLIMYDKSSRDKMKNESDGFNT
jgi:hypothetical protein